MFIIEMMAPLGMEVLTRRMGSSKCRGTVRSPRLDAVLEAGVEDLEEELIRFLFLGGLGAFLVLGRGSDG